MKRRINLTIRIEPDLKQEFVAKAKANNTCATDLLKNWMRQYLDGADFIEINGTNR